MTRCREGGRAATAFAKTGRLSRGTTITIMGNSHHFFLFFFHVCYFHLDFYVARVATIQGDRANRKKPVNPGKFRFLIFFFVDIQRKSRSKLPINVSGVKLSAFDLNRTCLRLRTDSIKKKMLGVHILFWFFSHICTECMLLFGTCFDI